MGYQNKHKNKSVAPYYEETRLARVPRQRDCIGESCPVAEQLGRCYTDRHHLYFSKGRFLAADNVYQRLRNDKHSIISMAKCRHSSSYQGSVHRLYGVVLFPRFDAAVQYLEESSVLSRLDVMVSSMANEIETLTTDNSEQRANDPARVAESLHNNLEDYNDLTRRVPTFEVLPARILASSLREIRSKKAETVDKKLVLL